MARSILIPAGMLVALVLGGCGAEPSDGLPEETPGTPEPTASSAPTTAPPDRPEFVLPASCAEMLPQSRLDDFAARGLELLGGPDGRYGDEYLAEPTPEQQAGGITCIWGDEEQLDSTVTVSVAPVSTSTRAAIIDDLVAQGLNEDRAGDAITYGQSGDEVSAPAILNYVRSDSWISVIQALGGIDRYNEAIALIDEVTTRVYR